MIRGIVTSQLEPVIRLTVLGQRGKRLKIDAVIDTGFNGDLSLPPELIHSLGLSWRRRGRATLADGTESLFDIYNAAAIWDRRRKPIKVDEADATPLIGMALLDGYELRVEAWPGGRVAITKRR